MTLAAALIERVMRRSASLAVGSPLWVIVLCEVRIYVRCPGEAREYEPFPPSVFKPAAAHTASTTMTGSRCCAAMIDRVSPFSKVVSRETDRGDSAADFERPKQSFTALIRGQNCTQIVSRFGLPDVNAPSAAIICTKRCNPGKAHCGRNFASRN
jgi:hypothetical protein